MADPASALIALGAAANVAQFIIYAAQILKRIEDFESKTNTVPQTLAELQIQLPLFVSTLNQTRRKARTGHYSKIELDALNPVLERCVSQVEELHRILGQVLPVDEDGAAIRAVKAVMSVAREKKIAGIMAALVGYVHLLTLHHAAHTGWPGFRKAGKIVSLTILTDIRLRKI